MKRIFSDGRSELILPPRDLLTRLCALIPQPRINLVRYFGAFAPSARGRAALTGQKSKNLPPVLSTTDDNLSEPSPPIPTTPTTTLGAPPPDPNRPSRLDWASLLARVHKIDVLVCRDCGGRLRVIAPSAGSGQASSPTSASPAKFSTTSRSRESSCPRPPVHHLRKRSCSTARTTIPASTRRRRSTDSSYKVSRRSSPLHEGPRLPRCSFSDEPPLTTNPAKRFSRSPSVRDTLHQ